MMGFTGTTVTPQIRSLIQEYHVGTIFLSAKNISCRSSANSRFCAMILG
jgi:beta-N-acetylhexosaminidase